MSDHDLKLLEEDSLLSLSGELPNGLPDEFVALFVAAKKDAEPCFRTNDQDIQSLFRLIKAAPTVSSLLNIFDRLRGTAFNVTTADMMEQEMLITAFIVTYSRLFASSSGVSGFG